MRVLDFEAEATHSFTYSCGQKIDLHGKVVLAFGGAGALSEPFLYAAASCGADIVLADYIPEENSRASQFLVHLKKIADNLASIKSGDKPLIIEADVRNIKDVIDASSAAVRQFGGIDVAVNFAGVHHPEFDLVLDDPVHLSDAFRRVININLNGSFNFTVAMARIMVPKRKGHIIHLCSSASRHSLYGSYGYNASKHGVEGLVQTAAAQLAPFGVRVNGLAPGTVITDLNRSLSFDSKGDPKPRAKSILAHTPTKHFATAEGIAETLIAMCIEQRHLTGNLIFPDDGYNIEGHSWPEGNMALYSGGEALEHLYSSFEERYPRK